MSRLKRIWLVIFSAGWVLPVWAAGMLAGSETFQLFEYLVFGGKEWPSFAVNHTSFPLERFQFEVAGWLFSLGCLWLVVVIVYWVLRLTAAARTEPAVQQAHPADAHEVS